jgi:hypothetical protein
VIVRGLSVHAIILGAALSIALTAATPAAAQTFQNLGPRKCLDCHDHAKEKQWAEKEDGPPPKNHLNSLKQLETDKTPKFIKAIGLADPYDPKGACAGCHATVVRNNVDYGVTCESCHGPASGYNDVHQQKGAYTKAVAAGLRDTVKKPEVWVPICMKCHVTEDQRLIAAGHPSGDDFNLGEKFATVAKHWKSSYPNKADITARGRTAMALIAGTRKVDTPLAVAASAPAVPATAPPAAAPVEAPVPPPAAAELPASEAPRATAATAIVPRPRPRAVPSLGLPPPRPPVPAVAEPPAAAGVTLPGVPAGFASALPASPAAALAAVQGRVIVLLDSLLRRGARAPVRPVPPESRTTYRGADAELLQLQQEVLALAMESLGTAPKPTAPPGVK